jgi:hypothetical protein
MVQGYNLKIHIVWLAVGIIAINQPHQVICNAFTNRVSIYGKWLRGAKTTDEERITKKMMVQDSLVAVSALAAVSVGIVALVYLLKSKKVGYRKIEDKEDDEKENWSEESENSVDNKENDSKPQPNTDIEMAVKKWTGSDKNISTAITLDGVRVTVSITKSKISCAMFKVDDFSLVKYPSLETFFRTLYKEEKYRNIPMEFHIYGEKTSSYNVSQDDNKDAILLSIKLPNIKSPRLTRTKKNNESSK